MSDLESNLRQIAEALRQLIRDTAPDLSEAIKWGNPTYEKKGRVCYLANMGGYINFGFFRGAHLADLEGRMEGTGKAMRHVKVRRLADINTEQFSSLVREAVTLNEQTQT